LGRIRTANPALHELQFPRRSRVERWEVAAMALSFLAFKNYFVTLIYSLTVEIREIPRLFIFALALVPQRTAALGESEQRFRQIAENIHEVFWLIDIVKQTMLYVSPAYEVETSAYRIIQEALTNVARHADVRAVTVRLWTDADTLGVVVADQGCGFDPQTVDPRRSGGLTGMHERAALLGGSLTIEAGRAGGTRLTATLPLHSGGGSRTQEQSP
jgi:anti-sigma regulatory factor (Ser/Thr protein kinase)